MCVFNASVNQPLLPTYDELRSPDSLRFRVNADKEKRAEATGPLSTVQQHDGGSKGVGFLAFVCACVFGCVCMCV